MNGFLSRAMRRGYHGGDSSAISCAKQRNTARKSAGKPPTDAAMAMTGNE